MNTIAKKTFPFGQSLELFQRKDGTYRLKFTGTRGCEIVYCLHDYEPASSTFDDFIDQAERLYKENYPSSNVNYGSFDLVHFIVWLMLARCTNEFTEGAILLARATRDMEEGLAHVQAIIDGEVPHTP